LASSKYAVSASLLAANVAKIERNGRMAGKGTDACGTTRAVTITRAPTRPAAIRR